jgi:hypothetical protein
MVLACAARAQHEGHKMPEQQGGHEHMHMAGMGQMNEAGMLLMEQASGTSMNPRSWSMPMVMKSAHNWHFMFMGQAFLVDTQQSGPRGHDKFYAPNWFMVAAEHAVGKGTFLLQFMPSFDPITVTQRRYPELFQTGETAYGRPIVDGQHPHDLIMSLGVQYARPLGEHTTAQIYFAPVGDPALGPVAFPHRASAAELPQAPLDHHWADSTHIANEVVTVAIMHKWARLEASGFYGTEPNENRWNIDHGPINSWSGRFSVFPNKNWMGQVSVGRLARPERQEEGDVVRSTASVHYTRPLASGQWSTSFIWGRNHKTLDRHNTNSYLVESVAPVRRKNFVTGRAEWIDKDELFVDHGTFRIGAYTLGYTRDVDLIPRLQSGVGANFSVYTLPDAIKRYYGDRPWGVNVYLRVRLRAQ